MAQSQMIVVSIVSHGHGEMVWRLVKQVLKCPEVEKIILTINIPENVPNFSDSRVNLVFNLNPKGFGENHNAAFKPITAEFFCVLNPDIELDENPFTVLTERFSNCNIGLVAPLVNSAVGKTEDSMRYFLTPLLLVKRMLGFNKGAYLTRGDGADLYPDWVAGMFMLFRSEAYRKVGGFDEHYFMYCEDADICTRLWKYGYVIAGVLQTKVTHNAQRASNKSIRHFFWHLQSMARYFLTHSYSLPKKNAVIRRN